MHRIRLLVLGSAAAVTLAGIGIAAAGSTSSSTSGLSARTHVIAQIQAAEVRAAANPAALAALQRLDAAVHAQPAAKGHGKPSNPPPPCPSAAPNAGGSQPCGVAGLVNKVCPTHSPNAGGTRPCGHPVPKPTSTATTAPPAACGPADQGGTPATGPISGPVYDIGQAITDNGGMPIGDLVQQIACAVFTNLGL